MADLAIEDVVDIIHRAPFQADGWTAALHAIARIAGGWGGQMFAQGGQNLNFIRFANLPHEALGEYVPAGGADPAQSPRLACGLRGPLMRSISDQHYLTDRVRDRYPIFRNLYDKYDAYYCGSAIVAREQNANIAIAIFQSRAAGDFTYGQFDTMNVLLPHLRKSFSLQFALELEAITMALDGLESFELAGLACDGTGKLLACSPRGEAFLQEEQFLRLRRGMVRTSSMACSAAFESALKLARSPPVVGHPTNSAVDLMSADGSRVRRVQITPFPREPAIGLAGAVLIAVPSARGRPSLRQLTGLGLTAAQAEVALALGEGCSIDEIAAARAVSRETIRTQVKAIYAKLNVHSIAQFMSRMQD